MPRFWWLWFLVLLVVNFLLVSLLLPIPGEDTKVPYTLFREQITAGNVEEIYVRGNMVEGTFQEPVTYSPVKSGQEGDNPTLLPVESGQEGDSLTSGGQEPREVEMFSTTLPTFVDSDLEELLIENGVVIQAEPVDRSPDWWLFLLLGFGPTLLLVGAFVWLFQRSGGQGGGMGGLMGLGKSRARRSDKQADEDRVTFEDVAGIGEAEKELVELVDFLTDHQKYTRLGGTVPKGVLLVGPPGTGKTLLARAVAGEAEVPFFSMSASEFMEMLAGVGASRVRDLFKQAREAAPAIVFIDELDAIGRARGQMPTGGGAEQEQTLNQILSEMDGFSSREGVIVLAATNQPDMLDRALLRPGRFDRRIAIQPPDRAGREEIFEVHTRSVPLAEDVDLGELASSTPGLTGADLKNLVNEAALMAARRDREKVHARDFLDALERITLGPARRLLMRQEERERIAYHESGHALLGLLLPGSDPVNRVTIVPRGGALGVTHQSPEDDRYNYDERYLRTKITVALGGRAAEEIVYGSRTTGAEDDIDHLTDLARRMVMRWGMSERLGTIAFAPRENPYLSSGQEPGYPGSAKPYSESTAQAIDDEVERIVGESREEAFRLLTENRDKLEVLVRALMKRETLDEEEILEVTGLSLASQPDGTAARREGDAS